MTRRWGLAVLLAVAALYPLANIGAQTRTSPPDFSGVWAPYRGGRGADPKLAAPPATPLALKAPYAKAYEERRAAEAAATSRGSVEESRGHSPLRLTRLDRHPPQSTD